MTFVALLVATWGAIHHFGWSDCLSIGAALYVLMPTEWAVAP